MPRLTLGKKFVRKMVKVGGGRTYCITLPLEAIREFGWKEGQKLVLDVDYKGKRFIIKDWEGEKKK